ncbi:universal stress protein [Inquilinus sp. KBS0705]|nr:universal stress protein [Inquilinus sp. KBS0705]
MKISKILIGIDESKNAEYAAAYGFELARTFNAHVGLVHIVEPSVTPESTVDSVTGMPMMNTGMVDAEVMDILSYNSDNIITRTIKKYGDGLKVTHFNEFGSTADAIVDCGKEFNADLIVLGTHSRTGLDRLFMGSVAENVVRHSQVPVLVVPLPAGA